MLSKPTVPDLLYSRAERTPEAPALYCRNSKGGWFYITWAEVRHFVSVLAGTLAEKGLAPGDAVGILGASRAEWDIAQFAVLACGGIVVGLDLYDTPEHTRSVVERSRLSALIGFDQKALKGVSDNVQRRFRFVMTLGRIDRATSSDAAQWDGQAGVGHLIGQEISVANLASSDAPAFMIFTSGTTGDPKGIVYTHRQVCAAIDAILSVFEDIHEGDHFACWLPLSNLFQRMVNFCAMERGGEIYYVEDPKQIVSSFDSINPHIFVAVPRFYEKLYNGIMERITSLPPWQQSLIDWALGVGDLHAHAMRNGLKPPLNVRLLLPLVDSLLLKRLRAVLGSNLRYAISGSAPMPQWLLRRFHAMGLLILEAYGLSENIVPMAANRPDCFAFGTVGQPLIGNEIKLDENGQLLVRGPGLFLGYYGESEANPRFNPDGFFETGDFGEIDAQGFIKLSGRTEDIIKTSTGRRIAPSAIEQCVCSVPYIEHAVVIGKSRKYLIAIVAVSASGLEVRVHRRTGKAPADGDDLVQTKLAVGADVARAQEKLPAYQRTVGLLVTTRPFSLEGGELTSNQKPRRSAIERRFTRQIEGLYDDLTVVGRSDQAIGVPYVVMMPT